jgi:hypothetical protein
MYLRKTLLASAMLACFSGNLVAASLIQEVRDAERVDRNSSITSPTEAEVDNFFDNGVVPARFVGYDTGSETANTFISRWGSISSSERRMWANMASRAETVLENLEIDLDAAVASLPATAKSVRVRTSNGHTVEYITANTPIVEWHTNEDDTTSGRVLNTGNQGTDEVITVKIDGKVVVRKPWREVGTREVADILKALGFDFESLLIGVIGQQLNALSQNQASMQMRAFASAVSGRAIGSLLGSGENGDNSGDSMPWNWWGSVNYTDSQDESAGFETDDETFNAMVGADYKVNDRAIFGLLGSVDSSEADLVSLNGNVDKLSVTVSAYGGYLLTDQVVLDGFLGYGVTYVDGVVLGGDVDGEYGTQKVLAGANISRMDEFGNIYLVTSGGINHTTEDNPDELDDVDLTRGMISAEVGQKGQSVSPYASIEVGHDLSSSSDDEDSDVTLAVGANLHWADNVSGSVRAHSVVARDDYDEWGLAAEFRMDF